ncbi:MAG: phosphate ABC transporter ATP-binding protein PstB [Anaerolineae bacterium]|nr:phosphate ABC transporter ATP-binding protein PstB [Anaerolineae bacterium]
MTNLNGRYAIQLHDVSVFYGHKPAIQHVTMPVVSRKITAYIGPSGCGKSTLLRVMNRMNDLVPSARVSGEVLFHGQNLYGPEIDPVEVRRRVGMVFQKPNPFPKSIYDNVAYGPRLLGVRDRAALDQIVAQSLKQAALWDEVRHELKKSGLALSGGQQQRLCIARALAVEPEVILMDEPCSALDPISTQKIEELMRDLSRHYTIVIVTHNMQQAQRVSDYTAFISVRKEERPNEEYRWGELVEYGSTMELFAHPQQEETADHIAGRFG